MPDLSDPWYLPGWDARLPSGGLWYEGRSGSGRSFRAPRLSAAEAEKVADRVLESALAARDERRLKEIVAAVSRSAVRLADPDDRSGAEAVELLGRELGWSGEAASDSLAEMGRIWSEEGLWSVILGEFHDPAVLEVFRPAPPARRTPEPASEPGAARIAAARRRRAAGPPLLFVVHAGNVPGVAVTAVIRGLLVRSGVLSKAPQEEPGLTALFCRNLYEEDPLLGSCVATTWWPAGEETPTWNAWSKRSGRVVAYGGEEAVRGVRSRLPAHLPMVVYGPKLGLGVLLPDVVPAHDRLTAAIAHDVCAYEQRGCVSPRLLYVLGGSAEAAEEFGERLGRALASELVRLPPPPVDAGSAVAIRALRSEAEFRGYGPGPESRVIGSEGDLSWTVIVEAEPRVETDGLPRVVRVHPVADLAGLEDVLRPLARRIQAIGYAGSDGAARLAELAVRLGVSRLAPFGRVAWPPADWRHDGHPQLLPLVDWTDWEMEE